MEKININNTKLKEYGDDIVSLSREYNNLIEELFELIKSIPDRRIISGIIGKQFIENILKEKKDYTNYGFCINRLGNTLIEYQQELSENINNHQIESIIYAPNQIKTTAYNHAYETKKFISEARENVKRISNNLDIWQNYVYEELNEINNEINNFLEWISNTEKKYNEVLETTRNKINQIKVLNIKKRESIIKSVK